jgi:hypothetical protein
MKTSMIKRFYAFLGTPLFLPSRIALVLLVVPLVFALTQPLWTIRMSAPQYPEGLTLDIYAYTVQGGHDGNDLKEINILNHYIGMHSLSRADMSDLDWIPFAILGLAILTLRCAAIGTVRSLVDIAVLTSYVGGFSFARFVCKLYNYGHSLDPSAPVHVDPFMPVILGKKQIANFLTESYPKSGTYLVAFFAVGVTLLLGWHLISGRRHARAAERRASQPDLEDEVARDLLPHS